MQAGSIAKRKRRIGEVIAYALSHRTRVLILIVLNEGTYTPGQIAEMIDEPLRAVSNHIRDMVAIGFIELVKTVKRRNMPQNYYRAIEMPCYTEEDMEAMTPEQRDVTWGLIIQSMAAEMMAALWQGTLRRTTRRSCPGAGTTLTPRASWKSTPCWNRHGNGSGRSSATR